MNVDDRIRATMQAQLRAEEARLANDAVGGLRRTRRRVEPPVLLATAALAAIVGVAGVLVWATRSTGSTTDTVVAVTPSTTDVPASIVAPTTTAAGPVTTAEVPPTTAVAPASTAPTTAPTTEAPLTTEAPPTTDAPPAPPAADLPETLVAFTQPDDLTRRYVEVDVATGSIVRDLATVALEATFPSRPEAVPDRSGIFYSQGWEDSWFSCDSSLPRIRFVGVDGGEPTVVASGAEPRVSPDGTRLAYLTSSRCIPDPADANYVLTPIDSVVVRDLATGAETTWVDDELASLDPTGLSYTELYRLELSGLVWLGDGELAVSGRRFSADLTSVAPAPAYVTEVFADTVIGFDPGTNDVLVEVRIPGDLSDDSVARLVGYDLDTGERTEREGRAAGPAADGGGFAATAGGLVVRLQDGAIVLPDGTSITPEVPLAGIDW